MDGGARFLAAQIIVVQMEKQYSALNLVHHYLPASGVWKLSWSPDQVQ